MLWWFKPKLVIQKPDGRFYFPKLVSVSTTETREFSVPSATIELITNRSPYTSEYINPITEDDIVSLYVACRMSPKEKEVFIPIFEGRIDSIEGQYNTKNNTTLSCKGHLNEASKLLIEESKVWAGTVEARTILSYFVNSAHYVNRLTWLNQAPYVDQTGTVNFSDTVSAYATTADQSYLYSIFQDIEKQAAGNWNLGTKCTYTAGGLLDKTYLTWKQKSTVATDKYKAIEGTARYLGSTFKISIEDQITQYKVKGDTPSGGTQYAGGAIENTAVAKYGRKTDVDTFSQLKSIATCNSIAAGVLPSKVAASVSGTITLVGTPEARPGDLVEVYAKSTELNGAIVSGNFMAERVRQEMASNSYRTSIDVGAVVVDVYDLISKIKSTTKVIKCNQVK